MPEPVSSVVVGDLYRRIRSWFVFLFGRMMLLVRRRPSGVIAKSGAIVAGGESDAFLELAAEGTLVVEAIS